MSASLVRDIRGFQRPWSWQARVTRSWCLKRNVSDTAHRGAMAGRFAPGSPRARQRSKTSLARPMRIKCFALAEESKALLRQRITQHKIDCDLTWGYMHAIPKAHQMDELKAWRDEYEELGVKGISLSEQSRAGTKARHHDLSRGAARKRGRASSPPELLPGPGAGRGQKRCRDL